MEAGIGFNNDVNTDYFRKHLVDNSVEYVLNLPLTWTPDTHFNYNDGTPQLLSAIIQKQTGTTLAAYADEQFFSRIGLTHYTWATYSDGITLGAFGLAMPPRELAKIAQCVCNNGMYGNEEVIPSNWIAQMIAVQVPDVDEDRGFGYLWWVTESSDYAFMWGHGGQYAVIVPSQNLVVVFTAIDQLSGDFEFGSYNALYFAQQVADLIQ
jgi:CubicO group peptidase (beta-lactamase class C family)